MLADISLLGSAIDFLTYQVPQDLVVRLKAGALVKVPLRNRSKYGIVVRIREQISESEELKKDLKELTELVDDRFIPEHLWALLRWAKNYYFANWGQVFQLVVPFSAFRHISKEDTIYSYEKFLNSKSTSELNSKFEPIWNAIKDQQHKTFLLFSLANCRLFKNYRELIVRTIKLPRSVIVLVPEIQLIPEAIKNLDLDDDLVVAWHSELKLSARCKIWNKVKSQKAAIVVGTRSALFLPVNNLGLIIISQEHSPYYKEERAFHYQARDLAIKYGEIAQAVVVLDSDTPSLESYYKADVKKIELISFFNPNVDFSRVQIVNLQQSHDQIISEPLREAILQAYQDGGRILIYHNRVGYARFVICRDCGYVSICPQCGLPLILDREKDLFICRLCSAQVSTFDVCPVCRGSIFIYRGWGIQKVVSELKKILPANAISVVTSETAALNENKAAVLVVTKFGLERLRREHFSLIALTWADSFLFVQDYRAGERAFQELVAVVHKATSNAKTNLIIQTYRPTNPVIKCAVQLDYQSFYDQELKTRQELFYPPFSSLTQINISNKSVEKVNSSAQTLLELFKNYPGVTCLGPTALAKAKKKFVQILLKSQMPLVNLISHDELRKHFDPKLKFDINVDP
ncbi:MAG: primosomal protein N' [candidate division WOR-3 bacterium]